MFVELFSSWEIKGANVLYLEKGFNNKTPSFNKCGKSSPLDGIKGAKYATLLLQINSNYNQLTDY